MLQAFNVGSHFRWPATGYTKAPPTQVVELVDVAFVERLHNGCCVVVGVGAALRCEGSELRCKHLSQHVSSSSSV